TSKERYSLKVSTSYNSSDVGTDRFFRLKSPKAFKTQNDGHIGVISKVEISLT
ncbi:MAG: hypothetical protein ACI9Z3_001691, partial [Roseivirga sp.]